MSMMLTGRKSKNCLPKNANGWPHRCRCISVRSIPCLLMNGRKSVNDTRNMIAAISVTMPSGSFGSSLFLVSSFSAWLSSCYSIAITTGRTNIMFPTLFVEFILGTTNPLTIGISAENQWVCLFCCQSCLRLSMYQYSVHDRIPILFIETIVFFFVTIEFF